ncbi:hypothetical protein Barb7_03197 [Bacteroidales bacterium Barb7]|nr:hypothetical protein Barb7_03197 [Bacteroidales bacterium Barb7]
MISPINAITPKGVLVIANPSITPVSAKGMENMMTNGSTSDSNCDAMTIKTSITINAINMPRSPKVSC